MHVLKDQSTSSYSSKTKFDSILLQVIKQDNRDVTDSGLITFLTHWLSRPSPLPTWSALIDAIKSPPIGYVDVADQIEAMLVENAPSLH